MYFGLTLKTAKIEKKEGEKTGSIFSWLNLGKLC